MTLIEAKAVAKVCETADGGCSSCIRALTKELNKTLPHFEWTYIEWDKPGDEDSHIQVTERSPM